MAREIDLEARGVVKRFGGFTAVDGVSFTIASGSFFSILGPSGCGKTTLLRMIAGFQAPDAGDIAIKQRSVLGVPPNRRPVSMVFQHLALFPMMTVAENIGYGLRRRKLPKAQIASRVEAMLGRVGLPGAGDKRIDQLSGGQQQRVAIARCLVLDPDVLLLDEPLGALDLKLREHMKVELKQLQADIGTTFVYITHDQSEALVMSDQVAVMNRGRFEQVASPEELYYQPATAFVAGFVGDANRWRGRVEAVDGDTARIFVGDDLTLIGTLADGAEPGATVEVFVRPEAIVLGPDADAVAGLANRMQGRVDSLLFNGANSRALIAEPSTDGAIMVALPEIGRRAQPKRGDDTYLGWDPDQTRCFRVTDRP
jgi:spermidine/putrescine transport system ATP-binding protein